MAGIQSTSPYKGSGQLTREQFLFYEVRMTAKLMCEGHTDSEILDVIMKDNLFQFPTEKNVKTITKTCLKRLHGLEDDTLVEAIAVRSSEEAKQICLFAMMKQYRLVWDFMIRVIGEKYQQQDFSFAKKDISIFMIQLQEQDDYVASWSDGTISKIRQVLTKILVETEYIDSNKSDRLNPVWLYPSLEESIKNSNLDIALPAFNCFS